MKEAVMEKHLSAALGIALLSTAFAAQAQTGGISVALDDLAKKVTAGRDAGREWCQKQPGCVGGSTQFNVPEPRRFLFGYPDASINTRADIGAWVAPNSGVSVLNVRGVGTRFHLNNVSDPMQCYVEYRQPTGFKKLPAISSVSTGCALLPDATGQNRFSAPQAAIYALNDSTPRDFPERVVSRMWGNGHAQTWDGRVFIRTVSYNDIGLTWVASTFRPERIQRDKNGKIDFGGWASNSNKSTSTVGKSYIIESSSRGSPGTPFINWLALVPDSAVQGENPYWSDEAGNPSQYGKHRTYKALVYHTVYADKITKKVIDYNQVGFRKATITVENAETPDANVASFSYDSQFFPLQTTSGFGFRCIEPTVTADGRLIICQGNPDNPEAIGRIVYSWNPTPNSATGWSPLKSIANLYHDQRNVVMKDGTPFYKRYPIAEFPIRDAYGNTLPKDYNVGGAYPWLNLDGSELFYVQLANATQRTVNVLGRWTGGQIRNIDGPINPGRGGSEQKLFYSSSGAFTTMWAPYQNVQDLKIPYSVRGAAYPIFGSNAQSYDEVDFEGFLDGHYVLHLSMNEAIGVNKNQFDIGATPDTSGNFNYARLVNAKFPLESPSYRRDISIGRYGQAIIFPANSYLDVTKAKGWDSFKTGLSLEFWMKRESLPISPIRPVMPGIPSRENVVPLFQVPGALNLSLVNGGQLKVQVTDGLGKTDVLSSPGTADVGADWTHVALTLNGSKSRLTLWVNGKEVASGPMRTKVAALKLVEAPVYIGPKDANANLIIDELKLSNVAREPWEVAYSANVTVNAPLPASVLSLIPEHLRPAARNAAGFKGYNPAAVNLGIALFHDPVLSRNRQTACATCHQPGRAFADGLPIARSHEPNGLGTRNSPMLLNRMFSTFQGWSGSADTLFDQPLVPMSAAHELNLPIEDVVKRLASSASYVKAFDAAFKQKPSTDNVRVALSSFVSTRFSPKSRVDSYLAGDRSQLTAPELRGMALFNGKARCVGCHSGVNYTDESFRSTVFVPKKDLGRAEISKRDRDFKLFKVPSLRSVNVTGPYMHDGSFKSLEDVVKAYNSGAPGVINRDTDIRPLELNQSEINDLLAFLQAL